MSSHAHDVAWVCLHKLVCVVMIGEPFKDCRESDNQVRRCAVCLSMMEKVADSGITFLEYDKFDLQAYIM